MTDSEKVLLGIIEIAEAKRLRSALASRGIALDLVANPETCGSGGKCGTSVEVHVAEPDLAEVREFLREERSKLLDGHEVVPGYESEVFDSEKGAARCPACGTQFSTELVECPDCGLVFAPDGQH